MTLPLLPYDPDVDNFGRRFLEIEPGKTITFEDAFENYSLVKKALQMDRPTYIPVEFTMFILRKMAIRENDFENFKKKLSPDALNYFDKLCEYLKTERNVRVHPRNEDGLPSGFRGIFIRIFCKKIFLNSCSQKIGDYDHLVVAFPFKISKNVPHYEIEVLNLLDDAFYEEIRQFLDEHFSGENAREICTIFLKNIRHFVETFDPAKSLRKRLEANYAGSVFDDYLTTFPRFNQGGIDWMMYLYEEYNNIRQSFEINVPLPVEKYNVEYFRKLPESNFIDLYSFLEPADFQKNRQTYIEKFKKYLFFFIHASKVDSNPIFAIDELLFECSKSLHRYKTSREDTSSTMVKVLAKIAILHMRKKPKFSKTDNKGAYFINELALKNIKRYISRLIENRNPRINVNFKTDLIVWIPYRTDDTYLDVCYSTRTEIKRLRERIFACVLCPKNDRIRKIINYNAYQGSIDTIDLPENIDTLKNFIKLCNTCDVTNEPLEISIDTFMGIFDRFIETEKDRL